MKNKVLNLASWSGAIAAFIHQAAAQAAVTPPDAAQIIASTVCGLVPEVMTLAWALALLMFIYGGAKYAYAADDPGGRKAGKNIAINALIGFIIVGIAKAVVSAIANGGASGATVC